MILILGKRIYRAVVFVLVLLIILPIIQFYAVRALNPQAVHFRQPRGEALKVVSELDSESHDITGLTRFFYFLHEFYQNGL